MAERSRPMKKEAVLQWCDRVLTAFFALSFILIAVLLAMSSISVLAKLVLSTGLPFLFITYMRQFLSKKRPYQNGVQAAPRKGDNDSFPSRHAFSAFLIAMTAFSIESLFGYALLVLAVLLSALRVFRGIHYPIDVIAGGFFGVFFGTICLIIL